MFFINCGHERTAADSFYADSDSEDASERFNLSLKETAVLFKKFDVLKYIRACFGIFHVEGDEAVFEEVKAYLKAKGAAV